MAVTAPEALREFDLQPSDNARLANLCGPLDENLRLLEARLDVQIRRRGDNFRVLGARADSAARSTSTRIPTNWTVGACRMTPTGTDDPM